MDTTNSFIIDLDGNSRIVNGIVDLGAYEHQKIQDTITVTNATCIGAGSCALYARLFQGKVVVQNSWLAGQTLNFSINGVPVGSAVTDPYGKAYLTVLPADPGVYTLTVQFAGSGNYAAATGTGTFTVLPSATAITLNPTSGHAGKAVLISGNLEQTPGYLGLAGQNVTILVDGSVVGTVTTGRYGAISFGYVLPSNTASGAHTISATYGGDTLDTLSSGSATLTVN